MIVHEFKADPFGRDACDSKEDDADEGRVSHCGRPRREHVDAEHGLRIQLSTALVEANALRAEKNGAYAERNQCVALLVRMALALGWRAGVRDHEDKPGEEWEADWRSLVCIDLPTGQVSWHFHDSEKHLLAGLPQYPASWDGHDTAEKYRRVRAALATPAQET